MTWLQLSPGEFLPFYHLLNRPSSRALFLLSELLEQHSGIHACSDTPLLARNDFSVDIAYHNDPVFGSASNTYTPWLRSAAGFSEGHIGTSPENSGLPYSVGDHTVVNAYNNDNYAPSTKSSTRAHEQPVADLANKHIDASFVGLTPRTLLRASSSPPDLTTSAGVQST